MDDKKQNKSHYQNDNRHGNKKKERKMKKHSRRCPHCGNEMRCRGASDSMGGISWKCRNKKCGRTIWERKKVIPPIPIVPQSLINKIN